jgi:hypothetical protein
MEFVTGSENGGRANGNAHLALCGRNDVIGRSDCEMKWLVGGLLGFAIFVVTLADQDGHEMMLFASGLKAAFADHVRREFSEKSLNEV